MNDKIVVFAGNECKKDHEEYYFSIAYKTGKLLAQKGFITVTGGGPGLMDQVCRGAQEAGGKTIGICLASSYEKHSRYLSEKSVYKYLNERQSKLINLGDHFLALPGGIGTLYEIMAILARKRKMEISANKELILIGDFYKNIENLLSFFMEEGFVREDHRLLLKYAKTPEEAINILKKNI